MIFRFSLARAARLSVFFRFSQISQVFRSWLNQAETSRAGEKLRRPWRDKRNKVVTTLSQKQDLMRYVGYTYQKLMKSTMWSWSCIVMYSANSYAGATVKTVLVCASNGFKRNTQPSGGADASFLLSKYSEYELRTVSKPCLHCVSSVWKNISKGTKSKIYRFGRMDFD